MPPPGCRPPSRAAAAGTRWPTGWRHTAPGSASPISSCCRSWSTRSAAPGAISRSANSRPARASARRRRSPASSTAATRWASASSSTGCRRISRPTRTASPASTAPRSTSTPTRARASTTTGTRYIFNLGRNEVRGFLIGSALFWLEHYHADGLRVDAVASMLYRDYSRNAGEWVPNQYGGRENLESVAVPAGPQPRHRRALPRRGADRRGKHRLARRDPAGRRGRARLPLTSGTWAGCTTRCTTCTRSRSTAAGTTARSPSAWSTPSARSSCCRCSHDEVVYGKGSLIRKMPGDDWQKFANLRAYFGFMWTHPGKKLLFMGGEFAQEREWNHDIGLDWYLLDDRKHSGRAVADPRPERRSTAASRRCMRAIATRPGSAGSWWTTPTTRCSPISAPVAHRRHAGAGGLQLHPGAAVRLPPRRAAGRRLGGACSTPTPRSMAAPTWVMAAASRPTP